MGSLYEYDLSDLIQDQPAVKMEKKNIPAFKRIDKEFIASLPFHWLAPALQLKSAASVKVALCCHHYGTLNRARGFEWFHITNNQAKKFGLTPESKNSGLMEIEKAGLIETQERSGKSRLIRVIQQRESRRSKA